jgi:hypothetical protein
MGDFERVLKLSPKGEKLRVPALSDAENFDMNRVYFGNPFRMFINQDLGSGGSGGGPNSRMPNSL